MSVNTDETPQYAKVTKNSDSTIANGIVLFGFLVSSPILYGIGNIENVLIIIIIVVGKNASFVNNGRTSRGDGVESDVRVKTFRSSCDDSGPTKRKEPTVSAVHSGRNVALRDGPIGQFD